MMGNYRHFPFEQRKNYDEATTTAVSFFVIGIIIILIIFAYMIFYENKSGTTIGSKFSSNSNVGKKIDEIKIEECEEVKFDFNEEIKAYTEINLGYEIPYTEALPGMNVYIKNRDNGKYLIVDEISGYDYVSEKPQSPNFRFSLGEANSITSEAIKLFKDSPYVIGSCNYLNEVGVLRSLTVPKALMQINTDKKFNCLKNEDEKMEDEKSNPEWYFNLDHLDMSFKQCGSRIMKNLAFVQNEEFYPQSCGRNYDYPIFVMEL